MPAERCQSKSVTASVRLCARDCASNRVLYSMQTADCERGKAACAASQLGSRLADVKGLQCLRQQQTAAFSAGGNTHGFASTLGSLPGGLEQGNGAPQDKHLPTKRNKPLGKRAHRYAARAADAGSHQGLGFRSSFHRLSARRSSVALATPTPRSPVPHLDRHSFLRSLLMHRLLMWRLVTSLVA